jgi:hypothetical protein
MGRRSVSAGAIDTRQARLSAEVEGWGQCGAFRICAAWGRAGSLSPAAAAATKLRTGDAVML